MQGSTPQLPAGSGSPCCPRWWRGGNLAPGSVEVWGGRCSGSQALVSPQLLRDSVMCDTQAVAGRVGA